MIQVTERITGKYSTWKVNKITERKQDKLLYSEEKRHKQTCPENMAIRGDAAGVKEQTD